MFSTRKMNCNLKNKHTHAMEGATNDSTKAALSIDGRVQPAKDCLCRLPVPCNYDKKTGTKPTVCYCACSFIQGINPNTTLNAMPNNLTTTSDADLGYKTNSENRNSVE